MSPSDFETLQKKVEECRSKRDRAIGARQSILKDLQSQFSVDTLEQAEEMLEQLLTKEGTAYDKIEAGEEDFRKEWPSLWVD